MLLATLRDTGYNIVLFIHVVTVIVAMAGAIAHPMLFALEEKRADGDVVALAARIETPSRIYSISYALTGLIGFGLISMGDWSWGATWIWLSIVLWVVSLGLLHGLMIPAEKAVAGGDAAAMARVKQIGPPLTLLIFAVVFLMTVKPGSDIL